MKKKLLIIELEGACKLYKIRGVVYGFMGLLLGVVIGLVFARCEYDYHIELDCDRIEILTDEGVKHTIDPDSLESFIIKDNL